MIPHIVEMNSIAQVDEIIATYANIFSIDSRSIIRIIPEKDELLIDQIRTLQSSLSLFQKEKRLITLEGVDNSSNELQNALLKTLEEANDMLLFLLPVVELQRILPTIISRCKVVFKGQEDSIHSSSPPLLSFASIVKSDKPWSHMNKTSAFSKEEVLRCIEEVLAALPTYPAFATQKNLSYILKIRKLIKDNNVNHTLGMDSILIFLSRQGSMKITHET